MSEPLLLSRRLAPRPAGAEPPEAPGSQGDDERPQETAASPLVLALSAAERQRLRGHCRSICGRDLLLQLPRGGGPLEPQERLAGDDGIARVRVEAAPEALLLVRSGDPLTLLRAAYHLGNRHVALELQPGELRLLQDPVLETLLRGLGLTVSAITAPFQPESGAYSAGGHGHGHGHGSHGHSSDDHGGAAHSHSHSDSHSPLDPHGHHPAH